MSSFENTSSLPSLTFSESTKDSDSKTANSHLILEKALQSNETKNENVDLQVKPKQPTPLSEQKEANPFKVLGHRAPLLENNLQDDSIPEITFEDCKSQLVANFAKYSAAHLASSHIVPSVAPKASGDFKPQSPKHYTSLNHGYSSFLTSPGEPVIPPFGPFANRFYKPPSFHHATNLKSIGVVSRKRPGEVNGQETSKPKDANKGSQSKIYVCPNEGCNKKYKNPNGLKYHAAQGRCQIYMVDYDKDKPHRCTYPNCFHSYKNNNGLKYHLEHAHNKKQEPDSTMDLTGSVTLPQQDSSRFKNVVPQAKASIPSVHRVDPSNLTISFRKLHPDFLELLLSNPPPPSVYGPPAKKFHGVKPEPKECRLPSN
ncbi:hypothetical protein DSO57_1014243 [Entomophthora muscae]|uniref:Uncharacterized protein n=1 Tax=Entomophthora muscae TaxID=34485 RepID=A0ACC2UET0_9FUNG|nr:hypothetical protein DSO57_1014243 [Entomophthora muscae]